MMNSGSPFGCFFGGKEEQVGNKCGLCVSVQWLQFRFLRMFERSQNAIGDGLLSFEDEPLVVVDVRHASFMGAACTGFSLHYIMELCVRL